MEATNTATSMIFNVLIKKDDNLYIAHCLELDIVTTSKVSNQVMEDIADLIKTQVEYAFSNNNLDYLYRSAPQEVWEEFYRCRERIIEKTIKSLENKLNQPFIPQWIVARMCESLKSCHA